ncbi:MAG: hypothetical protein HKP34_01425, partial [Nitrosopumilus sp.]|nr:hypothetical protein [Nitrosopumilus sp.]NNL36948.1 hypothetical protein [Nitrosopumilus sp.]
MKTTTVLIYGFVTIFVIFGIASYIQWEYAQEIKNVSEYHKSMSIPAISILDEIELNFQIIHMQNVQMIQLDPEDEKYLEHQEKYKKNLDTINSALLNYDNLASAKNSKGQVLASPSMQTKMHTFVLDVQQIIKNNDAQLQKYEKGEISRSEIFPLLENIENTFHKSIEENSKMEIEGMESIQNQVIIIEEKMGNVFLVSSGLAISSAIGIIILSSKFVSIPINRLILSTKNIANGEFKEISTNSKNSDVNNIAIALNKMSKDLETYKSKIIMQEKLSSIGELASRLAHDIKNPLTVIKVTLDVIKTKNKNLSDKELEKFERVNDAMYRITHQIDNVLDFIKGKPLEFEKFSVEKIFDSVIADLPSTDKIKILVSSENSEIECDFEAIKVVLINLIVNSMQAIENEG